MTDHSPVMATVCCTDCGCEQTWNRDKLTAENRKTGAEFWAACPNCSGRKLKLRTHRVTRLYVVYG